MILIYDTHSMISLLTEQSNKHIYTHPSSTAHCMWMEDWQSIACREQRCDLLPCTHTMAPQHALCLLHQLVLSLASLYPANTGVPKLAVLRSGPSASRPSEKLREEGEDGGEKEGAGNMSKSRLAQRFGAAAILRSLCIRKCSEAELESIRHSYRLCAYDEGGLLAAFFNMLTLLSYYTAKFLRFLYTPQGILAWAANCTYDVS